MEEHNAKHVKDYLFKSIWIFPRVNSFILGNRKTMLFFGTVERNLRWNLSFAIMKERFDLVKFEFSTATFYKTVLIHSTLQILYLVLIIDPTFQFPNFVQRYNIYACIHICIIPGDRVVRDPLAKEGDTRDQRRRFDLWVGRSPGAGNGNLL